VQNLTQFPLDAGLAPVVAGWTIYKNMTNIGDSMGVRIFYPVPGFAWNIMVNVGSSVLRGVSGVIEFVPGVVLLPLDADLDPSFGPAEDNSGLVQGENGTYDTRSGIDYPPAEG